MGARKKRRAEQRDGEGGAGGEGGADGQGFEKHNQFLWAKKMGQQNEPRWGLFKQVEYYYIWVLLLLYVSAYYYRAERGTVTKKFVLGSGGE